MPRIVSGSLEDFAGLNEISASITPKVIIGKGVVPNLNNVKSFTTDFITLANNTVSALGNTSNYKVVYITVTHTPSASTFDIFVYIQDFNQVPNQILVGDSI